MGSGGINTTTNPILPNVRIVEHSWVAKLAATKLNVRQVAMVLGNTIYLHNTSTEQFLHNQAWVKHEACHIRQFREHGYIAFLIKYLWESLLHGYHNNKYELEAREAETLD